MTPPMVNGLFFSLHTCIQRHFPVPVIDPIPTERFPEYVRDMLYGEENKLKMEFSVSILLCVNIIKTKLTLHSSN